MPTPAGARSVSVLKDLYQTSLALLTDLYQLTMAYGYWKTRSGDKEAVFHLFYRQNPFEGGFAVAAGLAFVIDFFRDFRFRQDDLAYLAELQGADDKPLFDGEFLKHLENMRFECDIDAVPEGTAVFPHQPLVRVRGPLLQCQLVETPLLNMINFQILIATKAVRVCMAAQGEPVLEFGLRRAHGVNGGLSASRAAYLGGCAATSNVLAGKLFGIPVKGTHAHSWVMSFDSEKEAFREYARALPNNCVFLVDTYDSIEGVKNAVETGFRLRSQGHEMIGIRLDSGDLAQLSIEARKILDAAGFEDCAIVASNNLDEHVITSLKDQRAAVNVWGVGTRLATAWDQPALGGVYKLSAIREPGEKWRYKVKLSEQAVKVNHPGVLQIRRYLDGETFLADAIYDLDLGIGDGCAAIDILDSTRRIVIEAGTPYQDLLEPVFRRGQCVAEPAPLEVSRSRVQKQLESLPSGVKRFLNPALYSVGLEKRLHDLKTRLILEARGARA